MIVGLSGLAASGKDTAADWLAKKHNFAKVALADPLKRIIKDVYNFSDEQLWGPSATRNAPDKRYVRALFERHDWQEDVKDSRYFRCARCQLRGDEATPECAVYLTPRFALQQLGTEWGRNCYVNTWVEYGLRTANELLARKSPSSDELNVEYSSKDGIFFPMYPVPAYRGVAVPDIRFKNEVESFKRAGAKLVRIRRPGAGLGGAAGLHASEQEQLQIPDSAFDAVIENDSTLEAFYQRLDAVIGALA